MIGNKKKGTQLGRFDLKQKLIKNSYDQYRLYYLIATIISPIFSFFIFDEASDIKNFYTNISIPLFFICVGIYSFFNVFIRNNLKYIFFVYCIFLTLYAFLIYVDSGYSLNNFLGFMTAYLAITIGLNDHRLSAFYSIFCLSTILIQYSIWGNSDQPIDIFIELTLFLIIGFIGFIIHYNSNSSFKTILYNEGLLSNILNSTGEGMLLLDENNQILDLNKKTKDLFKNENDSFLIGKRFDEISRPFKNSKDKSEFSREDNSIFICEIRKSKIEYQGWNYTIIVLSDITEKIEKNKELDSVKNLLVESEKTYRELFDNSYDLLFILDTELKIIDVNKRVLELFNFDEQSLLNKNFFDFIGQKETPDFKNWFHKQDNTIKSIQFFEKNFDLTVRKTTYFDISHFVLSAHPAENRIRYETILKESRDQMSMILENIDSVIYYQEVDEKKHVRLRYLSPKIENVVGISVDEFITLAKTGKINDIIHKDDLSAVEEKRKIILEEKIAVEFIYRVKKGEQYIWLEERIFPKFDAKGNHIANFGISTDVTNAQESKKALILAYKQYQDFIERNLAGFYRMNIKKDILDCNNSFARIFGFEKAADIIGKNVNEIYIDSTDRNTFVQNLITNKRVINNESNITLISKEQIWILENATLIKTAEGLDIIESTVFDITDLKRAEFALEKSEETLSMILNNIEDLIYNVEFNEDGSRNFNYLGNQVQKVTGLTKEEYIKFVTEKTVANLIHPDDLEELVRSAEAMKETKKPQSFQYRFKTKDNFIWIEENVFPQFNNEGRIIRIFGVVRDITEKKNSEQTLVASEEKFRLLFEATNDAIFILEHSRIIDCNDKSLETFGCTLEEKVEILKKGAHLPLMAPKFQPDGNPSLEKFEAKLKDLAKGDSQMFYWRFMRHDGVLFDAEVSLNSFQLSDKKYTQAIVRDITSRLKAEVALRESEDRFKMLSNATIEGIIFTENGTIIDSNEQFAFMYGFKSRNQVIGKNINDFLYSDEDIFTVNQIIENASEEKFEVKSKRLDGEVIWVESKGRIIPYHGRRLRVSVVYDITSRKIKEQELQESRQSFMNLTELSPNGSVIHIDGIIQYANPTVLTFLGMENSNELIGKNIINFLPDDQKEKSLNRIARIKKGYNIEYVEFNLMNKHGAIVEIGVQSVKIIYNGLDAVHVIIFDLSQQKQLQKEKLRAQLAEETNLLLAKEIQERKDAEQRLWETQMFTTNMFNSSLDMIMASDRNNLITQVNNSVLKTFGFTTEDIIGGHPKLLYASEEDFEIVRLSLLEKGVFSGEIKNKRKNGEPFTSFLSASVLRNTQGKIIGTMGISRDITESIMSQQKIRDQDAKIRSIFDNAANMLIWIIDTNYNLVSFNGNFSDILKSSFNVSVETGMNMSEIVRPLLSNELFEYSMQIFANTFAGNTSELEGPFNTVNGNKIWIETFLNPIFMEDGSIREISCISHEITEKKATESQIRQSLKEKEVLLKEVHHRVKNNLQVISSILNLQSSYVKDDQTLNILRESQNRIKSMSFIHESLYQTKNFSSINFSEYISNLSNNLFHSYQIFDNFIELKLRVEPVDLNLDQAIPCGLIVNELITNALKYAFKGRAEGAITIGISEKGKTVTLSIEDNGVGLPEGFNHLKTETLGLQLVVTLIEQLDGKLELSSKKGTKYLITFDKLN